MSRLHPLWEAVLSFPADVGNRVKANTMNTGHIEIAEPTLTQQQQFRLVEIAHETTDYEIRRIALEILDKELHPFCVFVPADVMSDHDYRGR